MYQKNKIQEKGKKDLLKTFLLLICIAARVCGLDRPLVRCGCWFLCSCASF